MGGWGGRGQAQDLQSCRTHKAFGGWVNEIVLQSSVGHHMIENYSTGVRLGCLQSPTHVFMSFTSF